MSEATELLNTYLRLLHSGQMSMSNSSCVEERPVRTTYFWTYHQLPRVAADSFWLGWGDAVRNQSIYSAWMIKEYYDFGYRLARNGVSARDAMAALNEYQNDMAMDYDKKEAECRSAHMPENFYEG